MSPSPSPDPFPPPSARAFAPASVGNVAVGFDLLGHSVAGAGDIATVRRTEAPGVRISAIRGVVTDLPREPEANTAGAALLSLLAAQAPGFGFELTLDKGIALGSGMGGSAASCVAALVAANALLEVPLPREALYPHALAGESVASGARTGDNVGPMLLGGLVLATPDRLLRLSPPAAWHCALVHPHFVLETLRAREVLAAPYPLAALVQQTANLSQVLLGCERGDAALVRAGLRDALVEPRRAPLVPGFAAVKQAALDAGAMGASLSGAGPSVFAWCEDAATARAAAAAMRTAFAGAGLGSDVFVSPLDGPAAALLPPGADSGAGPGFLR
ncbi:MAG TPA: homoserine kinase [Arenimonas sp.]|uniref:homoserine kinase n=1 Tax=Arenimonas sp. TaxID=1872635 RepID=UPI002D80EA39|nr:homoserine kinase [Arenimonas sp.]HEU0152643.1 homoserine kinase [Arenimonas sp.]